MEELQYDKTTVRRILEQYHSLKALGSRDSRYIIAKVDIADAVKRCVFTAQQKRVLELYFIRQYSLNETAKIMDTTRQNVSKHIDLIISKVVKELGEDDE